MPLKAVIFDMDGILSRTQRLHAKAQSEVLEEETGKDMRPEEITRRYAGREPGTFFEEEADAEKPMEMHSRKQEKLYELAEDSLEAVTGSIDLVKDLEGDYILGVASGSQPEFIEKVLDALEIKESFDSFTSGSEVERGKPSPDVFLEEAERLDVRPENCLVIEDGKAGMKGANEAGMVSVGVYDGESPADHTVSSVKELSLETVERFYREA